MRRGPLRAGRALALVVVAVTAAVAASLAVLDTRSEDHAAPGAAEPEWESAGTPVLRPIRGAACLSGVPGTPQRPCNPTIRGQYDISSLAISPDGRFLYAVSVYSGYRPGPDGKVDWIPGGTIAAFERDRRSGTLRQLDGADGCIRDVDAPINPVTMPCTRTARGIGGAKSIVLSRDGRFAYVAALNDNSIAAFERDARTGALRQIRGSGACVEDVREATGECSVTGRGLHGVRYITLSADGRNLYAASPANDSIAAFRVDERTGALVQLEGAGACVEDRLARLSGSCPAKAAGLNYPRSLTVSPDGRNVYVASDSADAGFPGDPANGNALSAFSRDTKTGALSQLPGDAACIKDELAGSETGCMVTGKGLFQAFAAVVSPDGRFVYTGSESRDGALGAFKRDRRTGALEQLEGDQACIGARQCRRASGIGGAESLTMTPDGRYIYVAAFFGRHVAVIERSPTTGRLGPAAVACVRDPRSTDACRVTAKGLDGPREIKLSPDGKFAYVPSSTSGTIAVLSVRYRR